jgi:hypothetical protein
MFFLNKRFDYTAEKMSRKDNKNFQLSIPQSFDNTNLMLKTKLYNHLKISSLAMNFNEFTEF